MIASKAILIGLLFVSSNCICHGSPNTSGSRIIFPDDNGYYQREIKRASSSNNEDNTKSVHNRYQEAIADETSSKKEEEDSGVSIDDLLRKGNITRPQQRRSEQLSPRPLECGPLSLVHTIYGGSEAALGEYPWMANLEYSKGGGDNLISECSGNIISHRYVLTAAHCVTGEIEQKIGRLVSLRVGDHNTQTPIDCDDDGCLDPYQRFGIERRIVHEQFRVDANKATHNDIALLRTDRNMKYSLSVAPICLPDAIYNLSPLTAGMQLTVIGWGRTGMQRQSPVKLSVVVPYVENEKCSFKLDDGQLCAGGVFMKDSCTGDSGGSLARLTSQAWFIEGIVSYGRGCGLEKPAVYTRVRFFLDWIHNNVEP